MRKLTHVCAKCGKTARAPELVSCLVALAPRCPAGHGAMKLRRDRPKKPLRGRKPRWRWAEGVRIDAPVRP